MGSHGIIRHTTPDRVWDDTLNPPLETPTVSPKTNKPKPLTAAELQAELVANYEKAAVKPKLKSESHDDHVRRIVGVIENGTDDSWEGLSDAAQDWYNANADAIGKNEPLTGFDGVKIDVPAEDEDEDDAPPAREGSKSKGASRASKASKSKTTKKKAPAKTTKKKAPAKTTKKKAGKGKGPGDKQGIRNGNVERVCRYVIDNPDATVADVCEALPNVSPKTVQTQFYPVIRTLREAQERGMFKRKLFADK